MNLTDKFAILTVDITAINKPRWFYPGNKLITGKATYDSIALKSLVKYCEVEYTIISGYVWNTIENTDMKQYIAKLYAKKQSAVGHDRDIFKCMLNSAMGKTLRRGTKTTKKKMFDSEAKARAYAATNQWMLDSIQEENEGKWSVVLSWCLDKTFNFSQVGIAILSQARAHMNQLFDECDELGISVYYHHTDCLLVETSKVSLLKDWIGNELGKLKVEAQGEDAVILNMKCYRVGTEHIRPRNAKLSVFDVQTV
jgi:hypothetical protein